MKKSVVLLLLLVIAFSASACSENKVEYSEEEREKYDIDKSWFVDNDWMLTINSVTTTEDRIEGYNLNPPKVAVIDYTYKNLGYENINGKQYGLLLSPVKVTYDVNGEEVEADMYPVCEFDSSTYELFNEGDIKEHAQMAYSVPESCTEITIYFQHIGHNQSSQSETFKYPIK